MKDTDARRAQSKACKPAPTARRRRGGRRSGGRAMPEAAYVGAMLLGLLVLGSTACATEAFPGETEATQKTEQTATAQQAVTGAWSYVNDFNHRMHRLQIWSAKNIFTGSCNNTRCMTGYRGYNCFDIVHGCNRRDMFLSRMYIQNGEAYPIADQGTSYDGLPDAETLVLLMPGQQSPSGESNYNTGMKDDGWKNSWDSNQVCSNTKAWRGNSLLGRLIANYKTLFGPKERVAFIVYGDTNKYCPCTGNCSNGVNIDKRNAISCHLLSYGSPGVTKRIIISGGSAGGITGLGVAHRIRSAYPEWSNVSMYVMAHDAMGCSNNVEGDFWQNPDKKFYNPLNNSKWVDSVPIDTKITNYPRTFVYQSMAGAAHTVIARHSVGYPKSTIGWSCFSEASCRTPAYSYNWYDASHDEISGRGPYFVNNGVADAAMDWLFWRLGGRNDAMVPSSYIGGHDGCDCPTNGYEDGYMGADPDCAAGTSWKNGCGCEYCYYSCKPVPDAYVGANDGCDCPASGDRTCDPDCAAANPTSNWCGCDYCYE